MHALQCQPQVMHSVAMQIERIETIGFSCSSDERGHFWNESDQDVCLGVCLQENGGQDQKVSTRHRITFTVSSFTFSHCRTETFILMKAASIHACNLSMFTVLYSMTLFILFVSTPSEYLGARQVFTTLSVVAYFRRETVVFYTCELMKLSDLNVALRRIQVRHYTHKLASSVIYRFQNLLCINELVGLRSATSMLYSVIYVKITNADRYSQIMGLKNGILVTRMVRILL